MRKLDVEKLKFSRCPNCRNFGIPAGVRFSRSGSLKLTCKYCKKTYRVNPAFGFFLKVIVIFFVCFLGFGKFFGVLFAFLLLTILGYFAPLQEVDED